MRARDGPRTCSSAARPPLFAWPSTLTAAIARPEPGATSQRRPTRKRRHRRFSSKQTLLGARVAPRAPPAPPRGPRAARRPRPRARPAPPSPAGPLPRGAGDRAPLTGSRGGGCSGDAPLPSAARARGGGFRCLGTAEGGSRASRGGGGGALTSRAAASQRARGPPRRPQSGRSPGEWAGPRWRTGRSIGRGGGARGPAGEWERGGAGRGQSGSLARPSPSGVWRRRRRRDLGSG